MHSNDPLSVQSYRYKSGHSDKWWEEKHKIIKFSNGKLYYDIECAYDPVATSGNIVFDKRTGTLDGVLFYPDLLAWDSIKEMTMLEYLKRQCSFVISY